MSLFCYDRFMELPNTNTEQNFTEAPVSSTEQERLGARLGGEPFTDRALALDNEVASEIAAMVGERLSEREPTRAEEFKAKIARRLGGTAASTHSSEM